tara:strand:- start:68 stop:280 length:213 start_codon:yes stop_codon:yes gene_type:complete
MSEVSKEVKISTSEMNKRIKQVTMEAEFRFKCLELSLPISKNVEDLMGNATKLYNYSFHIPEDKGLSEDK